MAPAEHAEEPTGGPPASQTIGGSPDEAMAHFRALQKRVEKEEAKRAALEKRVVTLETQVGYPVAH